MRWLTRSLGAILFIAAIALPLLAPTYYVQFATKVFILGILAMALNLVVGFGGLVSMCHAAFYGLAGLRSARCRCARAASISSW
jgi:branched-chain amino acid transport system permease protein